MIGTFASSRSARHLAGAVGDRLRHGIGLRARRREVEVDVRPSDTGVQRNELRRRDRPARQRIEAVLHADVRERAAGEAVLRPQAPDRGLVVLEVAAHPARVEDRVVDEARERCPLQVAVRDAGRDPDRREAEIPEQARGRVLRVLHGRLLGSAEPACRAEVVAQEVAVVHLVRRRPAVLEAAVRLDAVEEPRVVGRDHELLDRAAGAAGADRVPDRTVRLGDVLLQHHHRLRRDDVVAVVAADVEIRVRDHEPAREREVDDVVLRGAVRMPRRRAAAELVEQLVVPAGLRRPRRPAAGRVREHADVVEPAVHRAVLGADDVRHRHALVGRGRGDARRRRRARRVIRLERVRRRVHVDERDRRRRRCTGRPSAPETRSRSCRATAAPAAPRTPGRRSGGS